MNTKDKAKELVDKYWNNELFNHTSLEYAENSAKQCALIAVDYILNETRPDEGFIYWQEVKQEIEKL